MPEIRQWLREERADYRERAGAGGLVRGAAVRTFGGSVLIDTVSGRADWRCLCGDSDPESLDVLGPDVVSWLQVFTARAEQDLMALERELGEATDDEEERERRLEEAMGQDRDSWLEQFVAARAVRLARSSGTAWLHAVRRAVGKLLFNGAMFNVGQPGRLTDEVLGR